jgi:hypothetical protein
MATTEWFIVYPASEHPGNAFPANARVVSAQQGSPADNAWVSNGAYTIQGQSWQVDAGPFQTKAQAQAWHPGPITVNDWVTAGIAGVLLGAGNVPSPTQAVAVGSAVADTLGSFNIGAWFLRIGEILLGIVLVGVGIARITGAQNVVSKIVKAKVGL